MKKKIFIDARVLVPRNPSGIGHYVKSLIKELDAVLDSPDKNTSMSVFLITPSRAKNMLSRELDLRNIRFKRIYLPFRVMNLLVRIGALPPLDLFYGRGIYVFPGFVKPPLLWSSSIVFFYDLVHKKFPDTLNPKMLSLLESKADKSLQSNKVITISNSVKRELLDSFESVKSKDISVISPSVDSTIFYKRSIDEIISVKNRHHITGAYILSVGNLEPRKNLSTLVEAYKRLPQKLRDRYSLLIIGANSWNANEISNSINKAKNNGFNIITLVGKVSDEELAAFYSGASVFVFPSLYEGYGMPVIEAMSCGVPTIYSGDPAVAEAGKSAGSVVSDILNANEIVKNITEVLENEPLSKQLMNKGYKRVDESTDWTDSAEDFYRILNNMDLNKHRDGNLK